MESVAIYGITGALGDEVLQALEVDHEGIAELVPVAGPRSAGRTVRWRGAALPVLGPGDVDLADVDVAVFATRPDVTAREAPRVLKAGGRVIDASGLLARSGQAPLVWPQLAAQGAVELAVADAVALPSAIASTLAPILEAVVGASRVAGLAALASCDVVALVAASGAGKSGIDALSKQAVGLLNYQPIVDARPFPRTLAFDVLSEAEASALVSEERLQAELAALLPGLGVRPNLVTLWVPAFSGVVVTLTLRFAAADDRAGPSLVQTLSSAFAAHPDLALGERDDDDDDAPDDGDEPADADDGDDDGDDDDAPAPAPAATRAAAEVMGLRDAVDRDEVRVAPPTLALDGAVRVVAFADPLRRTAVAAQRLVARFIAELDADA